MTLMVLFVFCITPVHILHTLFANHKDQTTDINGGGYSMQINSAGINCHLSSNVITAPYLPSQIEFEPELPVYLSVVGIALVDFVKTEVILHSGLRAPPELS